MINQVISVKILIKVFTEIAIRNSCSFFLTGFELDWDWKGGIRVVVNTYQLHLSRVAELSRTGFTGITKLEVVVSGYPVSDRPVMHLYRLR